jgi:predicted ATPase/class 3 adenylate cyclase/DNA-binding CsgD family transcriptional regulator
MADSVAALPTGIVTFLLTDIEGSTRLWEAENEGMVIAAARHYALLDTIIAARGGVRPVEQGEGDSIVAAFEKASDALAAAVDIQLAFAVEQWPLERPLRVRIALHTGEAQLRNEGNYFGPTIIRCARLRAVAHGGQTVISGATRDVITDRLVEPVTLRDLGAHRLKDLGRPERVWQMCHPELESDFPALRSLNVLANNLPAELTTFVGRETELAELHDLLSTRRLVTLVGAGGCGKTRLALHAAADAVDEHANGVWWVELASIAHADLVPTAVATVLGFREEAGKTLTETLAGQLADQDTLIVLDNCEHVLDACARLAEALLTSAPNLRIVATSREALGVAGETAWHVPSLDADRAAQLFVERATLVRPNFAPRAEELSIVSRICDRLDGIPLAIELAAAWTRMMQLGQIAAALDDRFRLLTGGSRTAVPRQRTLESSVAWSHDLLEDRERMLLRRLSVFAGGFTLDAAESVCADDQLDGYAVLDLLSRLADKSLVQVSHEQRDARYSLLETIRYFARERLVEAGESDATRHRHLAAFLALAEQAAPEIALSDGPEWLSRLEREHDNLRAALEWAQAEHQDDLFLRLCGALTLFWELRGYLAEGGRWFARALATEGEPSVIRARALWGAAHVALYGNEFETTMRRVPEAIEMAQAVGDRWTEARASNTLGYLQMVSDPDAARLALERSIKLGREIGDAWAIADGLKMLTASFIFQDDHDADVDTLEQLRDAAVGLNKFFLAWYEVGRAYAAYRWGELDALREHAEASLRYCAECGDPITDGFAIALLAAGEALSGDYEAARERLQALLHVAEASGGSVAVPQALFQLSMMLLACGDAEGARAYIAPLLEESRTLGLTVYLSWSLCIVGGCELALGRLAEARTALDEARTVAAAFGNPWTSALAIHRLGDVARAEGDIGAAEDLYHDALVIRQKRRFAPDIAETLEALASIAVKQESALEAARLYGAADALRRSLGLARFPVAQSEYDANLEQARLLAGDDAYDAAFAEGAALSVDEAVGYASRARGERKRPSVGWDSLTPTEQRVVALTAAGLTNPQIAEKLFITRGTVKVHLAHIFTKLGVATRSELAAEATRRERSAPAAKK